MCFSPDKHSRLQKYHDENTSCIVTDIVKDKNLTFKLTNQSVVKQKTLLFDKNNEYEYTSIDTIINEFQQYQYVNVIVKVIGANALEPKENLSLREYTITDDGVNEIKLTMFEELVNAIELNKTYQIQNLQLNLFQNKKKLNSTPLTVVNIHEPLDLLNTDIVISETEKKEKSQTITFENVIDDSLVKTGQNCNTCKLSIAIDDNDKDAKLVLCINCQS